MDDRCAQLSAIIGFVIALATLGCSNDSTDQVATRQVDSMSIDRLESANSPKLPALESKPLYCWIAFGSDSVTEFLFVADLEAKKLYFDLNQNSDLSDTNEAFELKDDGAILHTQNWLATIPQIVNGKDTHTDLRIRFSESKQDVRTVVSVRLWGWDESTTDADLIPLRLADHFADAPIIHFGGPLTMGAYREPTKLIIGKETDFYSLVGTAGKNGGTLTAITNTEIPDDSHPKAEFRFPPKDKSQPPIEVTTFLEIRC